MHYVLEIVMPQIDDIEQAVNTILKPFSESDEENYNTFYDWYVIGGRWAGHKLTAGLDQDKLEQFYQELTDQKVTVSGMQCGKQNIEPADQIPLVDKIWASYFPEFKNRACPLFKHSNDQYANDCLYGDVLRLKDTSDNVSASRCIIANYGYQDKLEAITMFSRDIWNGVNHEDTQWDGNLKSAINMHNERIKTYKEEYKLRNTPDDDWIAVTVDYHS